MALKDPHYKLAGLEFLIQEFHKFIAYDSDIPRLMYDIRTCLNAIYAILEDLYRNKPPPLASQPTSFKGTSVKKIN